MDPLLKFLISEILLFSRIECSTVREFFLLDGFYKFSLFTHAVSKSLLACSVSWTP